MMDVTVKTLDGQNRNFSVPENITVRLFKEKIANSINIAADTQRLIFQGRVLQDEKPLKDYDVHGKVVHVVLRPPPGSGRPAGNENAQASTAAPGRDINSVVVGSFSLPSDIIDTNMVQNIAQDAIRSMGDMGRNARVSTRTSADGSAVDVHIHLGRVQTGAAVSEAQMRLNTAQQMMRLATEALNQLENPNGSDRAGQSSSTSSSPSSIPEPARATEEVPVQGTVTDTVTSTSGNQSILSPMETSETDEPSVSPTAAQSAREPAGGVHATADSGTSTNQSSATASPTQSNGNTSTPQQNGSESPRGPVRPNISALGEVLVEVNELNRRLQPHIERFTGIVQEDGEMNQTEQRENQRVCNMVSEAMHSVSHSYHALSDLMVDLGQNRPRQLYVTLAIAHPHTAVIQQTIPIQVSVPTTAASAAAAATMTTGTSTGPQPSTTESGTQSSEAGTQPATSTFGAQHDAGLSGDDMQRLTQQMSAGLHNVLGQGLQQGDGSPDNPYVFVEMGPDSMTVNSISAEVVTTDETGRRTTHSTNGTGSATPPDPPPAQQPNQGATTQGPTAQPLLGDQGQGIIPTNLIQNLVQQLVGQTGQGQPQRMQINIGQGAPHMMGFPGPGMPMGIRLGPRVMRPGTPRNESGTQPAGVNGVPANSGTQTSATPTSASGTQTTTNTNPISTAGTQTLGAPRAAAFVVPGIPGLAQNVSPADPYLPCSSRHFLTQHARGILNQAGAQNNDTALADMVSNLMSGLIGGTPQSGIEVSASATPTTTTGTAPGTTSTTAGGQPRPAVIRVGGPGVTFQMGGLPAGMAGLPAGMAGMPAGMAGMPAGMAGLPGMPAGIGGLGGMFRGQMPFMQGMRFRVATPRTNVPGARPTAPTTQPPTGSPSAAGTANQSSATTAGTPNQGSTGSGTQSSAGGQEPQFVQMLRSMLQSANQQQGGNQSNTASPRPGENQSNEPDSSQQGISDEAFTQLVSGITGYMSQAAMGQAPRQTIAEFLTGLGHSYSIPQGEGFINDILSCVLSHLQITDLISVFYGSPAPLNQVQQPLREFISTRVLGDSPPFQQTVRIAVADLVNSMQTEIQETVNSTQPRPHIDFLATLNHFFNQQIYNVVTLVMNSRDGDIHFGQDLYACIRRFLSELFMLSSRCLGGMQSVERMVSERLQLLTTGVNPFIQDWMASMTSQQISNFTPTIAVPEGEISHYLVYKEVGRPSSVATAQQATPTSRVAKPPVSSASTTTAKTETLSGAERDPSPFRTSTPKRVSKPRDEHKREVQPMETCSSVLTLSPVRNTQIEVDSHKPSSTMEVKGAASADSTSKPTVVTENQLSPAGTQSVNGDWQSILPAEWVPVITRDIEAQRNQLPQRPHSDVYLQGVPPKRRRLMTRDRPGDIANTADILPESIRQAVAAAAVEPISSLENLSSEVTNDTELHQAYESELTNTLTQRLDTDKDFKPERFPNTEDYFHKGSDTKK